MKQIFLALVLVLGLSATVFAMPDVSGIWTGGEFYIVLKQDGGKLTGSGGPDKNEQYPFTDGKIDGDRLTIKVGKFEMDLRVSPAGNEIRGEMRSGDQTMPVLVRRLDTSAPPPPAPTAFEIASIKLNTSGSRGAESHTRGGVLTLRNYPLKQMIENAYDVRDYSLSGPDWLDTLRFDVEARPPSQASREQIRIMMQALLAERFKLAIHRETKTMQGYALVVAKSGLKLKEVEIGPASTTGGRGTFVSTKVSMPRFADFLANRMNQPVQDKTEVKGVFDIKMEWSQEDNGPNAPDASALPGPTIFTALQEQLGLRLQAQKVQVEIVVVDHVEKMPTEN